MDTEIETQNGEPIEDPLPTITIADLPELLQHAVDNMGWKELSPVQATAIPYMLAQHDVMVQARTGSGKTGAFILPILERIDPTEDACQALVLVPTRELAQQVTKEAEALARETGVRVAAVYGGVRYGAQLRALSEGAHIVIGTPGRVLDHLLRKSLVLNAITTLILDEADRMLSMGFYPDMQEVQSYLPKRRVHSCMFSATFPPKVMGLARRFLQDPVFLNLSSDNIHVADVSHVFYVAPGMDKDRALVRLIEVENPESAIIFCNTRERVNYVTVVLQRFGYNAKQLTSDLDQKSREQVLDMLRIGQLRFLIATDVASRGIDIPDLSHAIQYEPPEDPEVYIHRAGRTGRAGAGGEAVTLVAGIEEMKLRKIAKQYGIEMQQRELPTDEDVARVVTERATTLLEAKLRGRDKLRTERIGRFMQMVRDLSVDEDEATLLAMLVDDFYQEAVHNPPPLPEPSSQQSQKESKPGSGRKRGKRSRGGRGRQQASKS